MKIEIVRENSLPHLRKCFFLTLLKIALKYCQQCAENADGATDWKWTNSHLVPAKIKTHLQFSSFFMVSFLYQSAVSNLNKKLLTSSSKLVMEETIFKSRISLLMKTIHVKLHNDENLPAEQMNCIFCVWNKVVKCQPKIWVSLWSRIHYPQVPTR